MDYSNSFIKESIAESQSHDLRKEPAPAQQPQASGMLQSVTHPIKTCANQISLPSK
jgi:hypothetical protein